jgi:geranylgeranyl diphosphate synthase type II
MDNSEMRRGKEANHIKYGEFTAVLAGDALQAAAFETLLNLDLPPATVIEMSRTLAHAAGVLGICGGQYLDLHGESKKLSMQELKQIHTKKTAAMISAAALIGVIAAGGSLTQQNAANEYAQAVGMAFQIRDDMLDITASAGELGKPTGADIKNNKTTFATLLGADACNIIIHSETENAIAALKGNFNNPESLINLAYMLADREF